MLFRFPTQPIYPRHVRRHGMLALFCLVALPLVLASCSGTSAARPTATSGPIATATPAAGPTVYLSSDAGYLYALSAVNGMPRWRVPIGMGLSGAEGQPLVANGVIYLIVMAPGIPQFSTHLLAVRASDGAIVWMNPLPHFEVTRFSLWNGTIYTTTQSYPDPTSQLLFAIDASTGAVRWQVNVGKNHDLLGVSGLVLASESAVYVVTGVDDSVLSAFNPHSGVLLWSTPMDDYMQGNLALSGDGNLVYLSTYSGTVAALHTSDGTPLWQTRPGSSAPGVHGFHLTLANNELYLTPALIQDVSPLFALDPATGATQWSLTPNLGGDVVPAFSGNILYLRDGLTVDAIDPTTRTLRWRYQYYNPALNSVIAVGNGEVFVNTTNIVYALRASDGVQLWSFKSDQTNAYFASPQVGP